MANKVKLIEKILPGIKYTNFSAANIKNFQINYNHEINCFSVNFLKKTEPEVIAEDFVKGNDFFANKEIKLNVNRDILIKNVLENIRNPPKLSFNVSKNIVIDFSSPNIAKPFHFGHLRSTIIGNFVSNIQKYNDNSVVKLNYLGDWGTQFGLLQYGLQAQNLNLNELKNNPINKLFEAYVYANKLSEKDENVYIEARKYFADIEHGKTDLEHWKLIRDITVKELENIYQRLGISFDVYHWESDYNGRVIKELINTLKERKIIVEDESGKHVARINNRNITVLKSDNSTLYITRDIAALLDRYEKYKFDEMLYVVDNSQTDHFAAVFEIVKQINSKYVKGCKHIKFGRIKGMSTRSGNVVFLNNILDEAKEKMFENQKLSKNTRSSAINEKTCDILGASAVILNDLKQNRQKDYTFSWEKALQTEGDSAIKLQYLHCRLWSLEQNNNSVPIPNFCEPKYLSEEIVGLVVAELIKFEDVLQKALNEYEACIIVSYLFRLAKHANRMYNELRVQDTSPELAAQRLLVFYSTRQILKTSLEILGVEPLYEM